MKKTGRLTWGERWARWRGPVIWLVIGLVAGPLISNAIGWQVTSRTAHKEVSQAIVRQQAAMCEMRVRAHVKNLTHKNFDQQSALAQKYAHFPWSHHVRQAVIDRCTNALAAQSTAQADGGGILGKPHS